MANNRYYLYCPYCGDATYFAKSCGGWHDRPKNMLYGYQVTAEDIGQFITDHMECVPSYQVLTPEWWPGTFIEIVSEYDKRLDAAESLDPSRTRGYRTRRKSARQGTR